MHSLSKLSVRWPSKTTVGPEGPRMHLLTAKSHCQPIVNTSNNRTYLCSGVKPQLDGMDGWNGQSNPNGVSCVGYLQESNLEDLLSEPVLLPSEKAWVWPKVIVSLLNNLGELPLPTCAFSNGASTYESFEDDPFKDKLSSSSTSLIVPRGHEQTTSLEARKG